MLNTRHVWHKIFGKLYKPQTDLFWRWGSKYCNAACWLQAGTQLRLPSWVRGLSRLMSPIKNHCHVIKKRICPLNVISSEIIDLSSNFRSELFFFGFFFQYFPYPIFQKLLIHFSSIRRKSLNKFSIIYDIFMTQFLYVQPWLTFSAGLRLCTVSDKHNF